MHLSSSQMTRRFTELLQYANFAAESMQSVRAGQPFSPVEVCCGLLGFLDWCMNMSNPDLAAFFRTEPSKSARMTAIAAMASMDALTAARIKHLHPHFNLEREVKLAEATASTAEWERAIVRAAIIICRGMVFHAFGLGPHQKIPLLHEMATTATHTELLTHHRTTYQTLNTQTTAPEQTFLGQAIGRLTQDGMTERTFPFLDLTCPGATQYGDGLVPCGKLKSFPVFALPLGYVCEDCGSLTFIQEAAAYDESMNDCDRRLDVHPQAHTHNYTVFTYYCRVRVNEQNMIDDAFFRFTGLISQSSRGGAIVSSLPGTYLVPSGIPMLNHLTTRWLDEANRGAIALSESLMKRSQAESQAGNRLTAFAFAQVALFISPKNPTAKRAFGIHQ